MNIKIKGKNENFVVVFFTKLQSNFVQSIDWSIRERKEK